MRSTSFLHVVLAAFAALAVTVHGQKKGWADSVSVNGKCYCSSNFDHGIGNVMVAGPGGKRITVKEACGLIGDAPNGGNRAYYNDIQCGNGPANNAGDEDWCPGRVDQGDGNRSKCNEKGPKWSFGSTATTATSMEATTTSDQDNDPPSFNPPVALFVDEPDPVASVASGGVLMGLQVVSGQDVKPLGSRIVLAEYPQGFGIRAVVSQSARINKVEFSSSNQWSKTEKFAPYDMFGSSDTWKDAPAGTVVITVVAYLSDGSTDAIEANIDLV